MENNKQFISQSVAEPDSDASLTGFFAIGITINIALIVAYLVWAFKQWDKKKQSGK